jgi:hypothetical protein
VLAFHEQVRQGWYILGDVACAAAIVAGVIMLAHAPLLSKDESAGEESAGGPPRPSRVRSEAARDPMERAGGRGQMPPG